MILAHDFGTTGDKACLYSTEGELLASTVVEYPTDYRTGGRVEQDPERWWNAVAAATRKLFETTSATGSDVECISFSGQMLGAVFLDGEGRPLRPAIIWADTRSQDQTARLVEGIGMERGYGITGHRFNPTYSLEKVMWVRDNEPETFSETRHVLLAKDYVAYRLTGVMATDPSDASSTNAYDQGAGDWSSEILAAAGIDAALLPEVVPSTTVLGGVTKGAAEETGLKEGTPVVLGGGDGPMAALGAGVASPADGTYAYLGSSSWVSLAADEPLLDPRMRTMTFDHVIPGRFVPTGTMQAGGASMEWVADLLAPGRADDRYEKLVGAAGEVAAADEGLIFLPYILGERSPYWNPRARGSFVGLAKHHGRAHLTRAVMEGVAMNLKVCLDAFEEQGHVIGSVDAIGGGARSDVWLQIFADVWGKPVARRSLVDEANALGAAVVGGVGVGLFDGFEIASTLSRIERTFEPDQRSHERYTARHAQFLDAYERLEPVFDDLQSD